MNDLDRYQADALRTAASYADDRDLTIRALGLVGEAGEVAELVKKQVGHGHPADPERVQKELGDVLWYVAALADAYGLRLSDIANATLAKLRKRYADGFSTEASLARIDVEASDAAA